jgi:hypothetical protein
MPQWLSTAVTLAPTKVKQLLWYQMKLVKILSKVQGGSNMTGTDCV